MGGRVARDELLKSKLTNNILGKIWRLADTDADGLLDDEEFALAQHLIKLKIAGHTIPDSLPAHLIPPRQRARMAEARKANGEEEQVNGQSNGVNGSNEACEKKFCFSFPKQALCIWFRTDCAS